MKGTMDHQYHDVLFGLNKNKEPVTHPLEPLKQIPTLAECIKKLK